MIQKFLKRVGTVALAALVTVGVVGCGSADVNMVDGRLPRAKSAQALDVAFDNYLAAVQAAGQDLHSIMIVKDGKVVKEQWMSEGDAATPHILNSVSKTFTATAVGFAIAEGKLSCQLYQRSADTFLGVPFNIASYALLTMMIAKECGLEVGDFVHTLGDAHLYLNHLEQADEQLQREPRELPKMLLNPDVKSIFDYKYEDFTLEDYDPHPAIKAPLSF